MLDKFKGLFVPSPESQAALREERFQSHLAEQMRRIEAETDAEIAEMTRWFEAHTIERRGRYRVVEPLIAVEIAFDVVHAHQVLQHVADPVQALAGDRLGERIEGVVPAAAYQRYLDLCYRQGLAAGLHSR